MEVRALDDDDRAWIRENAEALFHGKVVISRGKAHAPAELDGFMASGKRRKGLATYRIDGDDCELVTIDALEQYQGVGSVLLAAVEEAARARGCKRVWLITTNDNVDALRFYQRRGYRLTAAHPEALRESRRLKPAIPEVGFHGIQLRDELELEKRL